MLRVKIELVPFGDDNGAKTIHTLYIGNMGGTPETANYDAWLDVDPRQVPRPAPHGEVRNYERAQGAPRLVRHALEAVLRERPRK